MQMETPLPPGEMLRRVMRHWVTGISIVTSQFGENRHGMTVNSFGSISLDPPLVTVTMHHDTRTFRLVQQSGIFAVTILSQDQLSLAELFAGRVDDRGDRMVGLDTFTMTTGAPLFHGGLAYVDCQVVYQHPLVSSTLIIGEVQAASIGELIADGPGYVAEDRPPLVYFNRTFTRLAR